MELLKEMKSVKQGRKVADELPEHVAGADGQTEIVEKFREVYEALYNSSGSANEMDQIKARLAQVIGASSLLEANKVTGSVVKEAARLMKAGKSDVSGGFTSDAILNAPDLMFDNLASVYRSWLIHGSVTPVLPGNRWIFLAAQAL